MVLKVSLKKFVFLLLLLPVIISAQELVVLNNNMKLPEAIEGVFITNAFRISNAGTEKVQITGIKAGCGCTHAGTDLMALDPGQTTLVRFVFNTIGRQGLQRKNIFLTTASQRYNLSFSVPVKRLFWVEPRSVALGQVKKGTKKVTRTFRLYSDEGSDSCRIIQVDFNQEHMDVKWQAEPNGQYFEFTVVLFPEFYNRSVLERIQIQLKLEDGSKKLLPVVMVHGYIVE